MKNTAELICRKLRHVLCAVTVCFSPAVFAQTNEPSQFAIVMIAPLDRRDEYNALFENTRAQMVDLPVELSIVRTSYFPATDEIGKQAAATRVLDETQSNLVFWCNMEESGRVFFLVRRNTGNQMLVRELRGSGKEGIADAVSLIARTTVETLIEIGALIAPSVPPPETASPKESPKESSPKESSPHPEDTPAISRPPFFRAAISLSYAPQLVSFEPSVTHGGRAAIQFLFNDLVRVFMGITLSTSTESKTDTVRLTEMRFPFHLGLFTAASFGHWQVLGGMTAVFSIVKLTPRSLSDTVVVDAPFRRFGFSVEGLIETEYRPVNRFAVFLTAGVEVLINKSVYRVTNGPALFQDLERFQPKILSGMTVYFL